LAGLLRARRGAGLPEPGGELLRRVPGLRTPPRRAREEVLAEPGRHARGEPALPRRRFHSAASTCTWRRPSLSIVSAGGPPLVRIGRSSPGGKTSRSVSLGVQPARETATAISAAVDSTSIRQAPSGPATLSPSSSKDSAEKPPSPRCGNTQKPR